MVDLNTLIPQGSSLQLLYPITINERGEISGNGIPKGLPTGGDQGAFQHAFLLIPCDEDHADVEGCDYDTIDAETAAQARQAQIIGPSAPASGAKLAPIEMINPHRSALTRRSHEFGALSKATALIRSAAESPL